MIYCVKSTAVNRFVNAAVREWEGQCLVVLWLGLSLLMSLYREL